MVVLEVGTPPLRQGCSNTFPNCLCVLQLAHRLCNSFLVRRDLPYLLVGRPAGSFLFSYFEKQLAPSCRRTFTDSRGGNSLRSMGYYFGTRIALLVETERLVVSERRILDVAASVWYFE